MKKNLLLVALGIIIVLTLAACSPKTTAQTDTQVTPQSQSIIAEGQLLPAHSQDLAFGTNGFVSDVLVKSGDQVSAGQTLANLEPSTDSLQTLALAKQEVLNAQYALNQVKVSAELDLANVQLQAIDAKRELDNAQARYDASNSDSNKAKLDAASAQLKILEDKLAAINANNGVDPDKLAAANARLEAAQAALANAEKIVEAGTLTAKMAGTVVDLNLLPSDYVLRGSTVAAVADYSYWIVKTDNLSEVDVVNLKEGQTVEVTLDALPGSVFKGQITNIDSRYIENRGDITYTVTIKLSDTDPRMRWGMTAAVKFLK